MKRTWVFMDETGVLAQDPHQSYFGLGVLKIQETAAFYQDLNLIMQKAKSNINSNFEFKFNRINNNNKDLYIDFFEIFFKHKNVFFKAFVVDKLHPKFDLNKYFSGTWEAQIGYSKLLLRNIIPDDEMAAVVADYLCKPNSSRLHFETEIAGIPRPKTHASSASPLIFNACMLESHASLFIQIVDVLLGLVVYDAKSTKSGTTPNQAKNAVLAKLKARLGVSTLSKTLDVTAPPYFGVWCFTPK